MKGKGDIAIDTVPMPESIAIGTWPTPEKRMSRFRFECFFLDQLLAVGAIDSRVDLNARFRLNVEAVKLADSAGYFVERVPEVCESEFPPEWCLAAKGSMSGVVITGGRILLLDSLIANGALHRELRAGWLKVAQNYAFTDFAPSLFRHIEAKGWSAQKRLAVLDRSFAAVSSTAYPIPDGDLDRYCREHPEDPQCWIVGLGFGSWRARSLAQEMVLVYLLHQEELLSLEQTKAIYEATYRELATPRGSAMDLALPAGGIIVNGLTLKPEQQFVIVQSMATARIGYVDPDSPWADICLGKNPPPICRFISAFPVAATLTAELVKHKIWDQKDALEAWTRLHSTIAGGVVTGG
jgi:hypothetical protein